MAEQLSYRAPPGKDQFIVEADHDFLMKGDVFTKAAIEMWINCIRTKEVEALRLRPHPCEIFQYNDS
jgi:glutamine synthetase